VRRGIGAQSPNRGEAIEIEELTIDPANVQAYVDGLTADLTPTEFRLPREALMWRLHTRNGVGYELEAGAK